MSLSIILIICQQNFQSCVNETCHVVCSSCPYFKVGVVRTVPNSHVTVFCFIPLVFQKSRVLRTVNGAAYRSKYPRYKVDVKLPETSPVFRSIVIIIKIIILFLSTSCLSPLYIGSLQQREDNRRKLPQNMARIPRR